MWPHLKAVIQNTARVPRLRLGLGTPLCYLEVNFISSQLCANGRGRLPVVQGLLFSVLKYPGSRTIEGIRPIGGVGAEPSFPIHDEKETFLEL